MVAKVFLSHQICALSKMYKVTLITNLNEQEELLNWVPENVNIKDIPIKREINLLSDLRVLFLLVRFFYKSRFSLVHSVSPKAGLLAMLASYMAIVPVRLHTFTGQVWSTRRGVKRALLRWLDWMIDSLATKSIVDSHSQRNFLIRNKVITPSSSIVLGYGSISGVDLNHFKVDLVSRKKIRCKLEVSDSTVVFLFLGRLKKEKGILELVEAFSRVHQNLRNTALWIVGPDEEQLYLKVKEIKGVSLVPFSNTPEKYMAAADVLCLPSYREGFGNVVIEAAACEIPSIGSNIYGLNDAIVDGETGVLVPAKSIKDLETAMQLLAVDSKMRQEMGRAAHLRVSDKFSHIAQLDRLIELYFDLLKSACEKHTH